jgi:hypothetical protein
MATEKRTPYLHYVEGSGNVVGEDGVRGVVFDVWDGGNMHYHIRLEPADHREDLGMRGRRRRRRRRRERERGTGGCEEWKWGRVRGIWCKMVDCAGVVELNKGACGDVHVGMCVRVCMCVWWWYAPHPHQ